MTSFQDITCDVPLDLDLGSLLFLLYINDLLKSFSIITPIMAADDFFFFTHTKNIKPVFDKISIKLKHITEWLKSNMLSIVIDKTNFILFHKQ